MQSAPLAIILARGEQEAGASIDQAFDSLAARPVERERCEQGAQEAENPTSHELFGVIDAPRTDAMPKRVNLFVARFEGDPFVLFQPNMSSSTTLSSASDGATFNRSAVPSPKSIHEHQEK